VHDGDGRIDGSTGVVRFSLTVDENDCRFQESFALIQ